MSGSPGSTTKRIDVILASETRSPAVARNEIIEIAIERMHRLAGMMIRSYPVLQRWEQTDDIVQEAVIRLIRSLKTVKLESAHHFFNLATLQMRRTLIDLSRKHLGPMSQAANHESQFASGIEFNPADSSSGPKTIAQWTELHEAVGILPTDQREVFSLIWYAGTSQSDAARILGVSTKTIQRRYLAARLALAELHVEDLQE